MCEYSTGPRRCTIRPGTGECVVPPACETRVISVELRAKRHIAGEIAQTIEERALGLVHISAPGQEPVPLIVAVESLRDHRCLELHRTACVQTTPVTYIRQRSLRVQG